MFDKKSLYPAAAMAVIVVFVSGCSTASNLLAGGAADKNLDLSGYFLHGKIETVNPQSGSPQGRLILGRVTYRSRRVAIPADHKVPTTGSFRAVKTQTVFGTCENIIEYDFTAGDQATAEIVLGNLEKQLNNTATVFSEK